MDAGHIVADGSSVRIAKAIAGAGRSVQIVGRVGDDAAADAVLQDLARAGVGHVAILRVRPGRRRRPGPSQKRPMRAGPALMRRPRSTRRISSSRFDT